MHAFKRLQHLVDGALGVHEFVRLQRVQADSCGQVSFAWNRHREIFGKATRVMGRRAEWNGEVP